MAVAVFNHHLILSIHKKRRVRKKYDTKSVKKGVVWRREE